MSLEKHVTADTPPCFLWQTATDESVPVENSYLFAKACKEAGVPYAHHVFSDGVHGMSVATEDWLEERGREPYTMEQQRSIPMFRILCWDIAWDQVCCGSMCRCMEMDLPERSLWEWLRISRIIHLYQEEGCAVLWLHSAAGITGADW